MNEQRDSFVFYRTIFEAAEALPDDAAMLRFLRMVINFGLDQKMPENDRSPEYACFIASYKPIEKAYGRYRASVENGKKGGRPPANRQEDGEEGTAEGDTNFWPRVN